jgi:hypothetical protein
MKIAVQREFALMEMTGMIEVFVGMTTGTVVMVLGIHPAKLESRNAKMATHQSEESQMPRPGATGPPQSGGDVIGRWTPYTLANRQMP